MAQLPPFKESWTGPLKASGTMRSSISMTLDGEAHLRRMFQAPWLLGLTANRKKSHLGCTSIKFLGFRTGKGRIWVVPDKVEALAQSKDPRNLKELQRFLGLASYFCRFVHCFANLAAPLMDLPKGGSRGDKPIPWTTQAQDTFACLKRALCKYPMLHVPLSDKPFIVYTDASSVGLGAVISPREQLSLKGEHPIFFLSQKLTGHDQWYAVGY